MSKGSLNFTTNFSWTFIAQIVYVFSQFIIITIIARLGSVADVGQYGIVAAIVSPLQMFFLMDLNKLIVIDKEISRSISHYHLSFILLGIALPTVALLVGWIIYGSDFDLLLLILCFSLYRSAANYREYYFGLYQKVERMDLWAKSLISLSLTTVVVFSILYYCTNVLALAFLGNCFFYLGVLFVQQKSKFVELLGTSPFKISVSILKQKQILSKGVRLGANSFFISFKSNIPKYIIEFIVKDRVFLGYYTVFSQCTNALGNVNQSLARASIGRLKKLIDTNVNLFRNFLAKISITGVVIALIGTIAVYFLGESIVRTLFGAKYESEVYILLLLTCSYLFVMPATYYKVAQVILNEFNAQLYISILNVVLLIIFSLSAYYITLDVDSVLYSLILSEIVVLITTYYVVNKRIKSYKYERN